MHSAFGLFLFLFFVNIGINGMWVTWNSRGTLQYGFFNSVRSQSSAANFCQTSNFANVVTLRNQEEANDLNRAIYKFITSILKATKSTRQQDMKFWLGITRIQPNSLNTTLRQEVKATWKHYDNKLAKYTKWRRDFPKNETEFNCAVVTRNYSCACLLNWENRECFDSTGIEATICEKRENGSTLDNIENVINSNSHLDTYKINAITESILEAFADIGINENNFSQGVRLLFTLANKDKLTEVSKNTMKNVLSTFELYHDFIKNNLNKVTTTDKQCVAKTLELFLDRVHVNANEKTASFNTSTFLAEVRIINDATRSNLVFSAKNEAEDYTYIELPSAVLQYVNTTGAGNKSRITFLNYKDSSLFPSNFYVSQVLSAQVNGQPINGLPVPLKYSIPSYAAESSEVARYIQCASWNFSASSWTDKGCYVVERGNFPICACNHLTNFAVLVQMFSKPVYTVFNDVNRAIGGMSCVGFFLTAFIYSAFKELRRSKPGPVHINLCICYGIAYVVFLSGSHERQNEIPCLLVTVLSHFFFLAGWFWTLMEALTMYLLLVKKSMTLISNYMIYISAVAYVVPFVIVATNVGLTIGYYDHLPVQGFVKLSDSILHNSTYVSRHFCWLTRYSLYFGFLIEGGIIFAVNIVLYVYVLRSVTWGRNKVQSTRIDYTAGENICRAISIGIILGLVWVLAIPMELLANNSALVQPVTYLFSVLVALQGIIIFYLFCVRPQSTRRLWWNPAWMWIRKNIFCKRFRTRNLIIFRSKRNYIIRTASLNTQEAISTPKAGNRKNSKGKARAKLSEFRMDSVTLSNFDGVVAHKRCK